MPEKPKDKKCDYHADIRYYEWNESVDRSLAKRAPFESPAQLDNSQWALTRQPHDQPGGTEMDREQWKNGRGEPSTAGHNVQQVENKPDGCCLDKSREQTQDGRPILIPSQLL
jgi:hypothetical protein